MIAPMTLSGSFSWSFRWLKATPRALAGTVAACALALGLSLEAAQASYPLVPFDSALDAVVPALTQATAAARSFPAPGQYLFGQASEPDQIGHGYIVMDSNGQEVYGALYFPGSSFDCFHGRVAGNALAMTITDSYSEEVYPYAIALEPQSAIATEAVGQSAVPLNLSGFHSLDTLTDNDLRMLNVCKAEVEI